MDSALRPRDIQARIRAGESVENVARLAGVPVESIDAFAAPVLAEREHVAGLALSNPVRRRGETVSNRVLRKVITEHLIAEGVDPDTVDWDAYLLGARRWQVRATFARGEVQREALFVYDLNARFSSAANDDARWMIGDASNDEIVRQAQGGRSRVDDELALVRAVQGEPDAGEPDQDVDDAYTELELAEVDGVYDIVASDDSEMDVLYDMLASFDEDSVKIYAGLVHPELRQQPVVPEELQDASEESPQSQDADEGPVGGPGGEADAGTGQVRPSAPPSGPAPAGAGDESGAEQAEQPSLVEGAPPAKATRRTKRASVPSWDEIMFGAPRKNPGRS